MDLGINQLLQWCDEGAHIERVLWIDRTGQRLVTIDVEDEQAWPSYVDRSTLEHHLAIGDIRVLDDDVYGYLHQQDEAFTLSQIERRDEAWKVIEDIVAPQKVEGLVDGPFYSSYILDPLVQAAIEKTVYSKQLVHTYLRHYWQRGQVKNALLPKCDHPDSPGKERKSPDSHPLKRGRPSKVTKLTGVSTGVNIDDTIKECFRRGNELFYKEANKISRLGVYERTLTLFFHRGKELRDGVFVPLMPPINELPTFAQYQYWYRKIRDLERSCTVREDSLVFDTRRRAVPEHPRQTNIGPGFQYEFHVVIGDIMLVSTLDRQRILGRPVIYIIDDVSSDLITGMHVSLEGPNRQGTMLAFENMARDKVTYCQELGIEITEDEWPSHHLPKAILSNRSELLFKNANILLNALDIEIANTQPRQWGWKESFERCFPLLDDITIDQVPGSAKSFSELGRKGHHLDGCLTLNEFRRLVIECVIEHNIAHRLSDDHLDGDMIADGVEPYPRDVWKWGIQNRSGVLRVLPIDEARRSLLLEAEASVTREGIRFHQLHYTCDRAIQEQWFQQARAGMKGGLKIPILYDPRSPDRIYLRPQGGQPLEICWLFEQDEATFKGCDWFDIEDMIAHRTIRMATDKRDRQRRVELIPLRDLIIEEALREMGEAPGELVAEKGQERVNPTGDFQEQAASGAEQPQPVFKGAIERFFALYNKELFQ
jgi:putative transposase